MLWSGEGIGAATLVATPDGPIAAERLRRGARVLGAAGAVVALTEARHITLPAAAFRRLGLPTPVRIAAGALGFGMPAGPLLLGPAQRIRTAGGWITADLLVDGHGVRHCDDQAQIVLLDAGAPLLIAGMLLAPGGIGSTSTAPPESHAAGPEVAMLLRLADAPGAPRGLLEGFVDRADRFGVIGWARDSAAPDRIVPLEVIVAGRIAAHVLADRPRPDLARAAAQGRGREHGRHGFALRFAAPLPADRPWLVEVRRAGGGAALPGTPLLVDAAGASPPRFDISLAGLGISADDTFFLAGIVASASGNRRR